MKMKKERSQGGRVRGMYTKNGSYCETENKVGGIRVDANEEVKLL